MCCVPVVPCCGGWVVDVDAEVTDELDRCVGRCSVVVEVFGRCGSVCEVSWACRCWVERVGALACAVRGTGCYEFFVTAVCGVAVELDLGVWHGVVSFVGGCEAERGVVWVGGVVEEDWFVVFDAFCVEGEVCC